MASEAGYRRFGCGHTVREVIDSLRYTGLTIHVGELVGKAWADPVRVRQILRNLFSNAHRYGGNTVVVETRVEAGRSVVVVADDGSGIPVEHRERIFDANYQAAAPGQAERGSTGLGLHISRHLARLMGGDLTYPYEDSPTLMRTG